MSIIDLIGWMGMALLLGAFYLASSQRLSEQHVLYHGLNFVGAVAVMINAYAHSLLSVTAVELAWAGIALIGLWRRRSHALE